MASTPLDPDIALAGALPDLVAHERAFRARALGLGITYKIAAFGGFRTQADTTQILQFRDADYRLYVQRMRAAGRVPVDMYTFRPIAPFGHSYHDYGAAFDVLIDRVPPGLTATAALARLGALAPEVGLRWGGHFPKPDGPHFELAIGLDQARERWDALQAKTKGGGGGLASILALGIPGISVTGTSIQTPTIAGPTVATIQRHPMATATITTGALIALAMLAWVAVKRVRGE